MPSLAFLGVVPRGGKSPCSGRLGGLQRGKKGRRDALNAKAKPGRSIRRTPGGAVSKAAQAAPGCSRSRRARSPGFGRFFATAAAGWVRGESTAKKGEKVHDTLAHETLVKKAKHNRISPSADGAFVLQFLHGLSYFAVRAPPFFS